MSVLRTENLTYIYDQGTPYEKYAVDDVSVSIEKGEIVGIIGHTGSGKSTLIQHFNGLLKPSSGKVFFNDSDIYKSKSFLHDIKFKVGLVFQYPEYQLFEDTVEKDISYGPKNMKLSESEIKKNVIDAMKMTGISTKYLNKSPFELSGGQKRKVAIAGVIAMNPEVLVLDEPAAGLDPKGRRDIFSMLENYHDKTGCTIVIVSHSMEDVAVFADRLLVMNNSKVFCFDTPENVFKMSEEITKIGLDVPQVTKVFQRLKKSGLDLDDNIYTVDSAVESVLNYIKKGAVSDA